MSGEECERQRRCCGNARNPSRAAAALAAELPSQSRPHLVAVVFAAFGNRSFVDESEYVSKRRVLRAAVRAIAEMRLDALHFVVVVVVRYELFFCQVLHCFCPTKGSSDSRSLRTARKI